MVRSEEVVARVLGELEAGPHAGRQAYVFTMEGEDVADIVVMRLPMKRARRLAMLDSAERAA